MPRRPEKQPECGPDRLPAGRRRLRVTQRGAEKNPGALTSHIVTLIGSRRDCNLHINKTEISKIHCALVHTGREILVVDLCSRTGTFVDEKCVRVAPITPENRLRIGSHELATAWADNTNPDDAPAEARDEPQTPPEGPFNLQIGDHGLEMSTIGTTVDYDEQADSTCVALIGRRSACHVVVDGPDVSLVHALVLMFDGRPAIADLGSRSGTLLNGQRVEFGWLHDGDQLNIGGETLEVGCPWVPAADDVIDESVTENASDAAMAATDNDSAETISMLEQQVRFVLADLERSQRRADRREEALDRWSGELAAFSVLLQIQREYLDGVKLELDERSRNLDATDRQLQQRLDFVLRHEEALSRAWKQLEHWRDSLDADLQDIKSIKNDAPRVWATEPKEPSPPKTDPLSEFDLLGPWPARDAGEADSDGRPPTNA